MWNISLTFAIILNSYINICLSIYSSFVRNPKVLFLYLGLRYRSSIIYSDISSLHRRLDFEANYPSSKQERINGTVQILIRFFPEKKWKKLNSWQNKPYFMFSSGGDKITVSLAKQKERVERSWTLGKWGKNDSRILWSVKENRNWRDIAA